jgi:hypothetical protein
MGIILERGLRCEYCSRRVVASKDLSLHHIQELTLENVHDATVALNPDNVLVVHHGCHNKIHGKRGREFRQAVYIVYGSPMSGKGTFVAEQRAPGDLVVDMDSLFEALTGLPRYEKPDALLPNVKAVYNTLIDNIRTRYGGWSTAWVIGGYPEKYQREKLAEQLGAELVFIDTSKEECLRRLTADPERGEEWAGYIERWFERHTD